MRGHPPPAHRTGRDTFASSGSPHSHLSILFASSPLSRQVTDRIKSSSYRLWQHQHTLHIQRPIREHCRPSPGPVRNPAAVARPLSSAAVHPLIRMAVPTITSGVRLLLRLCRHAGRRPHDARLGDPVFARLRSSDAIRRPVRPFDPADGGQAAPTGSRASKRYADFRAG